MRGLRSRKAQGWDVTPLVSGFGFLAASSYLMNLRGPLLPLLTEELGLTYDISGMSFVVGHIAGLLATLALRPMLRWWGVRTLAVNVALGSIAMVLSTYLVTNLAGFLVFSGAMGAAAGVLGTLSNLLAMEGAPVRRRMRVLASLHAMYGLGSVVAPLAFSLILPAGLSWMWIPTLTIPAFISMAIWLRRSAPSSVLELEGAAEASPASTDSAATDSGSRGTFSAHTILIMVLFSFYVIGEVMSAMWLVTYLVDDGGYSIETASLGLSLWFGAMTVSRLACSFFLPEKHEQLAIWLSLLVPFLVLVAVQSFGLYWLLPAVGLVGPFFPLFVNSVGRVFPEEWESLTIWLMVALQAALAIAHLFQGIVVARFGSWWAFWIPCASLGIAAFLMVFHTREIAIALKSRPNRCAAKG